MQRRDFLTSLGAIALVDTVKTQEGQLGPSAAPIEEKKIADRWLELDLYWFDHEKIEQSVAEFLQRNFPLYKNVSGWRGVIVCVGWMMDYVGGFGGNLDQRIPFPEFDVAQFWPAHKRAIPLPRNHVTYPPWTYRDLKRLSDEFRHQAREKYGIADFMFGTLILGWQQIYGSGVTGWRSKHSEAWVPSTSALIPGAPLKADHQPYAAYPQGIQEGTPFYRFFARQWGTLSKGVGIDALVLRDGMWGQIEYREEGPFGTRGSSNPADMERWNEWTSNLVQETKLANPQCLVIGYSTAVSAVSEWWLDGFDLEQIAKEGHLDAWIDQSWGAGLNDSYLQYGLGYTFQLSNILIHAAQLSGTPTRHYVLIDTWDAWEPWDAIHAVPYKVQWEMWAYTHATVKSPEGDRVRDGTYISWANHGDELWTKRDVAFLAETVDAATEDALSVREMGGPTLVYSHGYIRCLNQRHPDWLVKEFIDDHAAMLMKWRVPILSVTRAEWVVSVRSDMFVFGTPGQLDEQVLTAIAKLYRDGEPLTIISDPTYGIDPRLNEIFESPGNTLNQQWELQEASIKTEERGVTDNLKANFLVWQGNYEALKPPRGNVICETNHCPDLVLEENSGKNLMYWNPPFLSPIGTRSSLLSTFRATNRRPFGGLIADTAPYILASRAVIKLLQNTARAPFDSSSVEHVPLTVHYRWTTDGVLMMLVGNLEREVKGDSAYIKRCYLKLPSCFISSHASEVRLSEVTQMVPGLESIALRRNAEGYWTAEVPVWPMGSSVWVVKVS